MSLQIKTVDIAPRRQTFAYLARRFGEDRPATRYEEATYDVQARANFHYRPIWAPDFEIHDTRRTAIEMPDWYVFKDPRQLYYATYNISRATMHQALEANFDTVENRNMLARVSPEWRQKVQDYLIPLRHYEWGANQNNFLIADYGYGTQITAAAAFHAADRLGMAQIIGRIGLAFDGNIGDALTTGKAAWLDAAHWQGIRKMLEDSLVADDWFEVFVAQNLAMDGVLHPLLFDKFDAEGLNHNGAALTMLSEFMVEWFRDSRRWVDACIKTAAAESAANKTLLGDWFAGWSSRAVEAAAPLAEHVLGANGSAAVAAVADELNGRAAAIGLSR